MAATQKLGLICVLDGVGLKVLVNNCIGYTPKFEDRTTVFSLSNIGLKSTQITKFNHNHHFIRIRLYLLKITLSAVCTQRLIGRYFSSIYLCCNTVFWQLSLFRVTCYCQRYLFRSYYYECFWEFLFLWKYIIWGHIGNISKTNVDIAMEWTLYNVTLIELLNFII